jgi:hypothetical protein
MTWVLGLKKNGHYPIQSSLQNTVKNLDTSRLNESSSLSMRMDTDYAFETATKLSSENKLNIATSVLAQTNNISANALKLLKE